MRTGLLLSCLLLGLYAHAGIAHAGSQQATTLLVGVEEANNFPFEYIDEQAQLTGFHVEVMRAVSARLDWQLEYRRRPWKRTMRALESGEVQAVSYVAKSPEREQFALFLPDNLLHVSGTTLYIKRARGRNHLPATAGTDDPTLAHRHAQRLLHER